MVVHDVVLTSTEKAKFFDVMRLNVPVRLPVLLWRKRQKFEELHSHFLSSLSYLKLRLLIDKMSGSFLKGAVARGAREAGAILRQEGGVEVGRFRMPTLKGQNLEKPHRLEF